MTGGRAAGLIALLLSATLLVSCAQADQWHPVTTEESQRLAIMRFNNFDAGTRGFSTELTVAGADLALHGWVDFVHHAGYAAVMEDDVNPSLLVWNGTSIALGSGVPERDGMPPLPLTRPDDSWQSRDLDASATVLDTLLLFLLNLGLDRPENPLLLQQAGALYLGQDTIDGEQMTIFAAPNSEGALTADDPTPTPETATVRLWLNDSNLLRRAEAHLGEQWVTIDFDTEPGPSLEEAA